MKQNNQLPLILLAILLLAAVAHINTGTFLLYGGHEIEAEITNITNECYTLGQDACARRPVTMIRLLDTGMLICPEGWYPTKVDCEKAYGLIKKAKEVEKPKISCYYIQDDVCWIEEFEEKCPSSGYFISKQACEESLIDWGYSVKKLFTNPKTWIMVGIGLVALLVIIFGSRRRR